MCSRPGFCLHSRTKARSSLSLRESMAARRRPKRAGSPAHPPRNLPARPARRSPRPQLVWCRPPPLTPPMPNTVPPAHKLHECAHKGHAAAWNLPVRPAHSIPRPRPRQSLPRASAAWQGKRCGSGSRGRAAALRPVRRRCPVAVAASPAVARAPLAGGAGGLGALLSRRGAAHWRRAARGDCVSARRRGAERPRHAPCGPAMSRLPQQGLVLAARGWRGAAGQTPLLPHTLNTARGSGSDTRLSQLTAPLSLLGSRESGSPQRRSGSPGRSSILGKNRQEFE